MEQPTLEDQFLTSKEFASRHGVTVRTVYKWKKRGIGPMPFKAGDGKQHLRYRLSDVLAWEQSRTRAAAGGAA